MCMLRELSSFFVAPLGIGIGSQSIRSDFTLVLVFCHLLLQPRLAFLTLAAGVRIRSGAKFYASDILETTSSLRGMFFCAMESLIVELPSVGSLRTVADR